MGMHFRKNCVMRGEYCGVLFSVTTADPVNCRASSRILNN